MFGAESMNWDAIGALSEAFGAIAVVASVAYLAVQVRKQTEESKMTASREMSLQMNDLIGDLTNDPELLKLYSVAIIDPDDLPDDDRLRIGLFFNRLFRCFEVQVLHFARDNVESSYFLSMNERMIEFMTFPGARKWWNLNKHTHHLDFQQYVDDTVVTAKERGYSSSFNKVDSSTEHAGT